MCDALIPHSRALNASLGPPHAVKARRCLSPLRDPIAFAAKEEFALSEVAAGESVVAVAPTPGGDVRMNVASSAAMIRIEHFLARGTTLVKPQILAKCSFPPVPGH